MDTVPALRHGLTQPLTMTGMLRGLTGIPTKVLGSISKADVGAFALRMSLRLKELREVASGSAEVRVLTRADSRELWVPPLPAVCAHGEKAASPSQEEGSHQELNLLGLDLGFSVSKAVGEQISVD